MKTITIRGIRNCPICGAKAIMRRNASKDFQVSCTKCAFNSGWTTKPYALIAWYNMTIQYWQNIGKLNLDTLDTPKKD